MPAETNGTTYAERTIASVAKNCAARNVVEVDGVLAELAKKYGTPVREMNDSELKRVNRDLPAFLTDYLEGQKRRGGPASSAAAAGTAGGSASIEAPKRKRKGGK